MHPVLIELGPVTLYSYGFFIAAAFILAMAWTMREAGLKGLDKRFVLDIGFYVLLGGLLGARLLFVALNPELYTDDPLGVFKFWQGGLNFMGGAFLASLFLIVYLRVNNQKILPWLDTAAPGVALGLFVGWLGCLAAGCGYGRPADFFWSITFTDSQALAPLFVSIHPAQAYHALAALGCFIVMLLIKNSFRVSGRLAGVFLIMYSLLRMIMDFFRDDLGLELGFMSVNQVLGLAVLAVGLILYFQKAGYEKSF